MKAMLIIDMPICCELCYLNRQREKGRYCVITETYDKNYGNVKENCPLKPIPKKKYEDEGETITWQSSSYGDEYELGFNDCIDEILGDEDE